MGSLGDPVTTDSYLKKNFYKIMKFFILKNALLRMRVLDKSANTPES